MIIDNTTAKAIDYILKRFNNDRAKVTSIWESSENYIITLMDIELIGTDRGIGQHIALNKKTQIPRPFAYMNELEEMREAYKNVIYTYEDHD